MKATDRLDVFGCELDGISLIEASAGTGKTWNICVLYLRLLLERGLRVQDILVVTFTRAATGELRERIRSRIVEMLGNGGKSAKECRHRFIERRPQRLGLIQGLGVAGVTTQVDQKLLHLTRR